MKVKMIKAIVVSIVIILADSSVSYASESDELLDTYEFDELNESLRELFPEEQLDFKGIVGDLISGELTLTGELLNRLVAEKVSYAFSSCRENLVHILVLALIAALFSNFSNIFQNRQISDVSFYAVYLLLLALCLNSFQLVVDWVSQGIETITRFMSVFCPVYMIAVSVAKGSVSAVAFYHLALLLIYLVELLILNILLPMIHIYMMIKILDHLAKEEYLSKFAELIQIAVEWILKTFAAVVIGLNVIQGLINPAIDAIKRSTITRSAEAIPGIGDALGGTADVVLGTAVLVKNGIGMSGTIICMALCVVPLVQTGCIVLIYKLAAAVIQPISDKRVVACVESVSDGCRLLLKVIYTTGLLFLLTIVIVSAVTSHV